MHGKQFLSIAVLLAVTTAQSVVVGRDAEPQSQGFPCCSKRDAEPEPTAEAQSVIVQGRDAYPQTAGGVGVLSYRAAEPQTAGGVGVLSYRDAAPQTAGGVGVLSYRDAAPAPTPVAEPQSVTAREAEPQSVTVREAEPQSVTAREAQAQPTPRDAEPQSAGFPCCSKRDASPEPTGEAQQLVTKRAATTFLTSVVGRDADAQNGNFVGGKGWGRRNAEPQIATKL